MNKENPFVSIIVVGHNDRVHLHDCFSSISAQAYKNFETIFVDNDSSDNSVRYVRKFFPSVKIVKNRSIGYAGGCNRGLEVARGKYVIFQTPDTLVAGDWLQELVDCAQDGEIGVCTPKIVLFDERDRINAAGVAVNFLGFAWCGEYRKPAASVSGKKELASASGTSLLVKKSVLSEVGAFDKDYFLYHEEVDLSWRTRLAGYKIMLVPSSVAYHKYSFSRNPKKIFFSERNRIISLLKNYSLKTLLLIFPAFLAGETGAFAYALLHGNITGKLQGYAYIIRNRKTILAKRSSIQKARKVSDGDIARLFTGRIEFEEVSSPALTHVLNPLLGAYWKLARHLI